MGKCVLDGVQVMRQIKKKKKTTQTTSNQTVFPFMAQIFSFFTQP